MSKTISQIEAEFWVAFEALVEAKRNDSPGTSQEFALALVKFRQADAAFIAACAELQEENEYHNNEVIYAAEVWDEEFGYTT